MNTLLIYFALPVATIILAVVLQKLIDCYKLVTAIFFAIYLVVTFAAFDSDFLIYAIAYTLLAYIAAYLTYIIDKIIKRFNLNHNKHNCRCNDNTNNSNDLLTISCNGCNGVNNDLLTISSNCASNNQLINANDNTSLNPINAVNDINAVNPVSTTSNNNSCGNNNIQNVDLQASILANSLNNGRTGNFNGCYRRR